MHFSEHSVSTTTASAITTRPWSEHLLNPPQRYLSSEDPRRSYLVNNLSPTEKGLMVVAHPGHELRVLGWLDWCRPDCIILSDGGGKRGEGRFDVSKQLLEDISCVLINDCPLMTDQHIYQQLLSQNYGEFFSFAELIFDKLKDPQIDYIVADSAEGFNPSHDVVRMIVNAATKAADCYRERPLRNYEFALVGDPQYVLPGSETSVAWLQLSEEALLFKLMQARGYESLRSEVETALNAYGYEAFMTECLIPIVMPSQFGYHSAPPYYEKVGRERVKSGTYAHALCFREHVLPLGQRLLHWTNEKIIANE